MARYPNAGQVLWVAAVKGKVKKVEIKESHHWTRPYLSNKTYTTRFVKENLPPTAMKSQGVVGGGVSGQGVVGMTRAK